MVKEVAERVLGWAGKAEGAAKEESAPDLETVSKTPGCL